MISHGDEYTHSDPNTIPSIEERIKELKLARQKAMDRSKKCHESSKKRYDLRKKPGRFSVGDVVYRRSFVLSDANKKIQAKFCPWVKSKVLSVHGQTYELEDLNTHRKAVFHRKDIKPG
ncbi:uncharacterized protein LOC129804440 [Phlebotomus papatasi]|uniref:uncharacterized protein LOC129804440 n=1 Tax=Phlebotomus papatasi TaxID=29031 RepID=UPI0024845FAD|nr:uncharacterized protein LOC129804440 [Phlebotomus papatasi]